MAPVKEPEVEISEVTESHAKPYYDKGRLNRVLAICGLGFSVLFSFTFLVAGFHIAANRDPQQHSWATRKITIGTAAVKLVIFILNGLITFCNESLGYIHTSILKWALLKEGRLQYNSNLRLFSNCKSSRPNSWYCNGLVFFGIVFSHTSTMMVFSSAYDKAGYEVVSALGCIMLGLGIGLQCTVVGWAFRSHGKELPTWSLHPLDTAAAAISRQYLVHRPNRCMMGADSSKYAACPTWPRRKQQAMFACRTEVKWVLRSQAAIAIVFIIWVISLFSVFDHRGFKISTIMNNHQWFGVFFSMSALQAIMALTLHLAELVVNSSRDEHIWRKASRQHGLPRMRENPLLALAKSWQAILLLVLKPVTHWIFTFAIKFPINPSSTTNDIFVFATRNLLLTGCAVFFFLFSLLLSVVAKPTGPQPATFGHLQTLADLIDDWPKKMDMMHWGEKVSQTYGGVAHAGTSTRPLHAVRLDVQYAGSDSTVQRLRNVSDKSPRAKVLALSAEGTWSGKGSGTRLVY